MTCRECESGPGRLCVACYEREQYGELSSAFGPNWARDWKKWAGMMRVGLTQKAPPKESL